VSCNGAVKFVVDFSPRRPSSGRFFLTGYARLRRIASKS
jgi:hypothetical protein